MYVNISCHSKVRHACVCVCVCVERCMGRGLRYRPMPKAFNGSTDTKLGNCLLSLQQAETTSITVKEIKEIKHELHGNVYTVL